MRVKSHRRQEPAKAISWADRAIPDTPAARRAMLRELVRTADDETIWTALDWATKPRIPVDRIVHLNDCTPAELKRLKHMSSAELRALAKKQAKARAGKAVRP